MNNNDYTQLNKYQNKWVAIKKDGQNTVVGAGDTLKQALEQSRKQGVDKPLLTRVPKNYGVFVL